MTFVAIGELRVNLHFSFHFLSELKSNEIKVLVILLVENRCVHITCYVMDNRSQQHYFLKYIVQCKTGSLRVM